MPATVEELEAINYLRHIEGRPPLSGPEIAALMQEPEAGPEAEPALDREQAAALAYLRALEGRWPVEAA